MRGHNRATGKPLRDNGADAILDGVDVGPHRFERLHWWPRLRRHCKSCYWDWVDHDHRPDWTPARPLPLYTLLWFLRYNPAQPDAAKPDDVRSYPQ